MQEEYTMSMSTDWHNRPDPITEYSPRGMWEYVIITPWKITGSFSTILNKRFLINADIEQTDYGFTRMYSEYEDDGWLAKQNGKINDLYVAATNSSNGCCKEDPVCVTVFDCVFVYASSKTITPVPAVCKVKSLFVTTFFIVLPTISKFPNTLAELST